MCCPHLAVGVAGAALPPTGQHRGVLGGSAALAALLLHRLFVQWLRGAGWVCQGVCMGVWGHPVTGLHTGLGGPLPGLGVSLLSGPVMLHSLFQCLVGDQHSLAHFRGSAVWHWGQVGVRRSCGKFRLLFGGGTGIRVVGGAVGTEGRPSKEAGDGHGLHLLAVAFRAGSLPVTPRGGARDDCGGLRGRLQVRLEAARAVLRGEGGNEVGGVWPGWAVRPIEARLRYGGRAVWLGLGVGLRRGVRVSVCLQSPQHLLNT